MDSTNWSRDPNSCLGWHSPPSSCPCHSTVHHAPSPVEGACQESIHGARKQKPVDQLEHGRIAHRERNCQPCRSPSTRSRRDRALQILPRVGHVSVDFAGFKSFWMADGIQNEKLDLKRWVAWVSCVWATRWILPLGTTWVILSSPRGKIAWKDHLDGGPGFIMRQARSHRFSSEPIAKSSVSGNPLHTPNIASFSRGRREWR
jgi:hypothetical protein